MRARLLAVSAVLLLGVLAGCGGGDAPAARTPTPLDHATTGTIAGVVSLEGTPAAMSELRLGSDPGCAAQHQGPVLAGDALVHDGHVEDAFVWLKEGLGDRVFAVPAEAVKVDQKGCLYHPRVVGAQVGQAVAFVNSDPLLHNVHGTPAAARGWNFGLPVQGARRTIRVDKPEVMISLRCDVHPWMQGWLGVVDHPYFAVTGADGRFTLRDVPPGDYVVGAWHERFGTREARVSLPPHGAAEASVAFAAR